MATWMDRRGIPRHKELKADKEFERRFPEMYNSIQPQHMVMFLVAMAIAIVVPFTLTLIVGKRKGIH